MWTFMTSGVVAATIVGNIVNNVNNNNNNNDNMNMNMNMVNMAMGKGFRNPIKNIDLNSTLCHILTLYFTKQSSECARRVLCEANKHESGSELSRVMQKTVSIAAGLIADDIIDNLSVSEVLEAVNSKECHKKFPCIPKI